VKNQRIETGKKQQQENAKYEKNLYLQIKSTYLKKTDKKKEGTRICTQCEIIRVRDLHGPPQTHENHIITFKN